MSVQYMEIRDLCDILEAELEGRPYDRSRAMELASRLGDAFPGIQQSIGQICRRIGSETSHLSHG